MRYALILILSATIILGAAAAASQPDADRPIVEYPDGHFKNAPEAMREGLRLVRRESHGRRVLLSWQGQGARPDSYRILEIWLVGNIVSFGKLPIDLKQACVSEGFDFDAMRRTSSNELNISPLSVEDAAKLFEAIFVKHLHSKAFEESNDYSLGFEYVREPKHPTEPASPSGAASPKPQP